MSDRAPLGPLKEPQSARRKVTIVSMNLSTNCTNRCFRLAQALAPHFETEIVGTTFGVGKRWGEGIWPPLEGCADVSIKGVPGDYLPRYLRSIPKLLRLMDGDVIVACKPRFASLGIALLHKLIWRKPVILDIDDDELAQTMPGKQASLLKKLAHPGGYLWTRVIHPLHRFVNAKFVVSENFRQRYGGTLVPHPLDPDEIDPARFDRSKVRREFDIRDDQVVVGFIGTPGAQKGTDLLPEALERIPDENLLLMIVGAEVNDPYALAMKRRAGNRLLLVPMQPLARLPEFLAAADIIALPQRSTDETWGQMPAKLTDAMAMAKPIIAAERADMPAYLAGERGLTFSADDIDGLVECLQWLLDHRDEWARIGNAARSYFETHLSYQAVGDIMNTAIRKLLPREG